MERSATAFTAADRIGQLAVQINDITDARRLLAELGVVAVTLWAGRVGEPSSRPRCGSSCTPTTPSCCRTTSQATLLHAERLHAAGILDDDELAEATDAARDDRATIDPSDEDVHSSIERQLGEVGRKIHAGRSRNDQVAAAFRLYVADACAEAERRARGVRARDPRARRGGGDDADARLHAPAARAAGDARPPPARVGRDARARPRAVRVRGARRRRRRRSAPARSPARRCRCRRRRTRCATRSTPSPTATSRSTTSTRRAVLFTHLSRIGEELVLWTTSEFGFARLPGGRGDRLVDHAAEAEPRRRRARARQGRHGDRPADRPARDGQVAAARLRPRPAGGQAAGVRRAPRRRRRARARCAVLVARPRVRPRPARRRDRRPAAARDRRRRGARRARACRSATRTSRSRRRCARERSRRRRPATGSATSRPRSPPRRERWS